MHSTVSRVNIPSSVVPPGFTPRAAEAWATRSSAPSRAQEMLVQTFTR